MADLDLIPLTALRAVEAVARLGTLSRAGAELGITPGAVSQRIQRAEEGLGRMLFLRSATGMVPTDLCRDMMGLLSRGMADLSRAVAMAQEARDGSLTVSVAPLFAGRWLVWRLGAFQQQNPGLRVRIEPAAQLVDPRQGEVDLCLRVGTGDWPGLEVTPLIAQHIFPVCSPTLAARLRHPADLATVPIIREDNGHGDWPLWLDGSGVSASHLGAGPVYADGGICLDAAMAGQGVFLGWETLAGFGLDRGQLVEPFAPRRVPSGRGLFLLGAPGAMRRPALRRFRDWLAGELRPLAASA